MAKKLEKNGMCPTHRILSEEERLELVRAIGVSMWLAMPAHFIIWGEYAEREIVGFAAKVDTLTRMVKITGVEAEEWIYFDDIFKIIS